MTSRNIFIELTDGTMGKYDDMEVTESGWIRTVLRAPEMHLERHIPAHRVRETVAFNTAKEAPFADPLYTATRMRHLADIAEGELQLDDKDARTVAHDAVAAMRACADELETVAERSEADE